MITPVRLPHRGNRGRRMNVPLLPLLAVLALQAEAAGPTPEPERWIRVDRTADLALYVDRMRIRVIDSTIVEIWAAWEFTSTQTLVDKKFNRMVDLFRLDCKNIESMNIEGNFYLDSVFVKRVPTPEPLREWSTAPPQSINETLIIRGCLIAQGKPTEPVK